MRPTPCLQKALRRLPLTTKQGPHNYYKGNRTGAMGEHTKWGGYKVDYGKVRTYVCPDLTDFQLTPFVSKRVEKRHDSFEHTETKSPVDGKEYLRRWKEIDGHSEHGGIAPAEFGGVTEEVSAVEGDKGASGEMGQFKG